MDAYKNVIVEKFKVAYVDDPDLYASEKLIEFEKSNLGQWLMDNCHTTPTWYRDRNTIDYCFHYEIHASLTEKQYTYYILKFK